MRMTDLSISLNARLSASLGAGLRANLRACWATAVLLGVTTAAQAGPLLVSAASSLSNAFSEITQKYEAQYPGVKVVLNFAASGQLLQQLEQGAPLDVLATADQETMDAAQKKGLVAASERRDFVRNTLVLVVPKGRPVKFRRLEDLDQPAVLRIAIGNPANVPAGRYARQALQAARLWSVVQAQSVYTQNVRQALDFVVRGEVDAGFVYGTDYALLPDKVTLAFEVPLAEPILYPIAKTQGSKNGMEAKRFIAFVLAPDGQAIFSKYGFQKP